MKKIIYAVSITLTFLSISAYAGVAVTSSVKSPVTPVKTAPAIPILQKAISNATAAKTVALTPSKIMVLSERVAKVFDFEREATTYMLKAYDQKRVVNDMMFETTYKKFELDNLNSQSASSEEKRKKYDEYKAYAAHFDTASKELDLDLKQLKFLEENLQKEYDKVFPHWIRQKTIAGEIRKLVIPTKQENISARERTQMAVIYVNTLVRRYFLTPAHTELGSLKFAGDCAGDVIGDMNLANYGISLSNLDFAGSFKQLMNFSTQIECMSSRQMNRYDKSLALALESVMPMLTTFGQRQEFLQYVLNPLYLVYDLRKPFGSKLYSFIRTYKETIKSVYTPINDQFISRTEYSKAASSSTGDIKIGLKPFSSIGFFLTNDLGALQYVDLKKLDTNKFSSIHMVETPPQDVEMLYHDADRTKYDAKLGIIFATFCRRCSPLLAGSSYGGYCINDKSIFSGSPVSWPEFVEMTASPEWMGFGAARSITTFARGVPDVANICVDPVMLATSNEGGSLSCEKTKTVKHDPKACTPSPFSPFNGPGDPAGQSLSGDSGAASSLMKFKSNYGCGRTNPYGEVQGEPVLIEGDVYCHNCSFEATNITGDAPKQTGDTGSSGSSGSGGSVPKEPTKEPRSAGTTGSNGNNSQGDTGQTSKKNNKKVLSPNDLTLTPNKQDPNSLVDPRLLAVEEADQQSHGSFVDQDGQTIRPPMPELEDVSLVGKGFDGMKIKKDWSNFTIVPADKKKANENFKRAYNKWYENGYVDKFIDEHEKVFCANMSCPVYSPEEMQKIANKVSALPSYYAFYYFIIGKGRYQIVTFDDETGKVNYASDPIELKKDDECGGITDSPVGKVWGVNGQTHLDENGKPEGFSYDPGQLESWTDEQIETCNNTVCHEFSHAFSLFIAPYDSTQTTRCEQETNDNKVNFGIGVKLSGAIDITTVGSWKDGQNVTQPDTTYNFFTGYNFDDDSGGASQSGSSSSAPQGIGSANASPLGSGGTNGNSGGGGSQDQGKGGNSGGSNFTENPMSDSTYGNACTSRQLTVGSFFDCAKASSASGGWEGPGNPAGGINPPDPGPNPLTGKTSFANYGAGASTKAYGPSGPGGPDPIPPEGGGSYNNGQDASACGFGNGPAINSGLFFGSSTGAGVTDPCPDCHVGNAASAGSSVMNKNSSLQSAQINNNKKKQGKL